MYGKENGEKVEASADPLMCVKILNQSEVLCDF